MNLRDWSGQSILEKAQTRREGPGGEVWYRRNLHELTIQTELTPALQILFSRYLDYARGIGSNGFSAPMTWESLMAWRHETDEPQLTWFERDCFFSLRSVHQEIAAKKAEKPKETRG